MIKEETIKDKIDELQKELENRESKGYIFGTIAPYHFIQALKWVIEVNEELEL